MGFDEEGTVVGSLLGAYDGVKVGSSVGAIVGTTLGAFTGDLVGWLTGLFVGNPLGDSEIVGSNDGWRVELGYEVAPFARGFNEGALVGVIVGKLNEGDADGSSVGCVDGSSVGLTVGRRVVGARVGLLEGRLVGSF